MTSVSNLCLPTNCFLSDAFAIDVRDGRLSSTGHQSVDDLASRTAAQSRAMVEKDTSRLPSNAAAAISIPIYREGELVSIVVFVAMNDSSDAADECEPVGVFEIWQPIGLYDELALADGYYGRMERFQNVSSFVRFECGNGLPGQVWGKRMGVIHDDLSNHPGFLRAAGASADLLQTAIGIPVINEDFIASVVLISSHRSPIARGFEVWQRSDECFELLGGSYIGFDDEASLVAGTKLGIDDGWARLLHDTGGAVCTDNPDALMFGRQCNSDANVPKSGMAIPQYRGSRLDSFVTLLF
ncbi:hypothetical protein CA13_48290 [Planctomycetes bacterium CA13]|uniref:GAF domain-containing protein n=1 Tax=Novipirellula herctigrandis TaxID=2527986 RepID=A0A5C5Z7S9_9BACT|nr:hypothetical protein CA13_48290 [Planctomycetes bacterium CA13]